MRYTRKVKEETKRAYLGAEYDSPLKDIVQKWTFNNNPYLAGYYGQQSQLSYGQQNPLNYGQQNQLNYGQPDPVDIAMRQTEHFSKTPWNPDTHILIYETETEEMFFAYILDEGKWKALVKKNISRRNNNLRGGVNNVQVIKDKGIPVCKNITFISAKPFRREDKPGKKYYEIKFVTAKGAFNIVIEKKEFDSSSLCRIAEGVLEEGQEKLCSCLFRIMINQLLENEFEITIPMYAGWYKDDVYGMVYLDKLEYPSLPDNAISTGMRKRIIDPTGFNKDDFLSTLITTIKDEWQLHFILGLRLSSPLLLILERKGIQPRLIIAPIIDTLKQSDVVTALLKTNDLFSLNTVSLNKNEIGCEKEIAGSRDGVAVLSGPRTAAEAKINEKNVRIVRDAAIGANGTENITRCLVTIIGRFLPKCLMPEEYLAVDCLNISTEIDVRVLRAYVLLFDSIYIKYIENNWDKVQGIVERTVENYKAKPDSDVASEYQDLYIALLAVIKVMKECFGIDLFSSENFYQVKKLFADSSQSEISPDHTVKKQFISVARKMIFEGEFRIMDLKEANGNYSNDRNTLILDRKKGFLSFDMSAIEKIAAAISIVKDGSELTGVLKACNCICCSDNGARQITAAGKRQAFYSVYLSELGNDILDVIDMFDKGEFFFEPDDVPTNFIPIIWYNGRCAGVVLDGEGLPNPHCNISGLSGMGKNRGAYRNAEYYLKCNSKVLFLDVKGGSTALSLYNDMKCEPGKYEIYDPKVEGMVFDVFNVSCFVGKNAKVSYILNIISAAVSLSDNQYSDLSSYVDSMVCDDTKTFSLAELIDKFPPRKNVGLKNKLMPFVNIMNSYAPKDGEYRYSSCREFIEERSKITILSIAQSSQAALHTVVYTLLQSLFEHQVLDNSIRLAIYADEMQKYTADSPFKHMFAEGRQFNIYMTGMTQEYRSKDNATRKDTSNAAMEVFYAPTADSLKRVADTLGKKYNVDEHQSKGRGYIWGKGYFWSRTANRHEFALLKGLNEAPDYS